MNAVKYLLLIHLQPFPLKSFKGWQACQNRSDKHTLNTKSQKTLIKWGLLMFNLDYTGHHTYPHHPHGAAHLYIYPS